VEANSTGGQGSRRAVAPSDDDDDDDSMWKAPRSCCLNHCSLGINLDLRDRTHLTKSLVKYIAKIVQ
jgi:hypothetical protein